MHDRKKLIAALVAAGMTEEEAEQALVLPGADPSAPPNGGAAPLPGEPELGEPEPDESDEPEADPSVSPGGAAPKSLILPSAVGRMADSETQRVSDLGVPAPLPGEPDAPEADPEPPLAGEVAPPQAGSEGSTPDLAAENAKLRESLISALLRSGGLAAGVKPDRLDALVKLADVSAVDPLADDAAEQVNAAVAAALEMVPELAPANPAAAIPGALGQHPRNTGKSLSAFERGLLG